MSEFSESYHLQADDQQAGVHLLRRARLDGFVFPPQRGWVTIIPRSEFGETPDGLVEANEGWLLRYLLDQDAGWMFQVYTGPILASYECRWLDRNDPEHRIKVDASGVDVEVVWTLTCTTATTSSSCSCSGSCTLASCGGPARRRASTTMTSWTGRQGRRSTMSPTPSPGWLGCRTTSGCDGGMMPMRTGNGSSMAPSGSGADHAGP
jgi:hypothetical protein